MNGLQPIDLTISPASPRTPEHSNKAKGVAEELLSSPRNYTTPPLKKRAISFLPPTPGTRTVPHPNLENLPFPNLQNSSKSKVFEDIDIPNNISISCYQTSKGKILPLIKQPRQNYSCGPGALMNAFLGMAFKAVEPEKFMVIVDSLINNEQFFNWYVQAQMQTGSDLVRQLSFLLQDFNIEAVSRNYSMADLDTPHVRVSSTQEVLEDLKIFSNLDTPVLVGIDHPKLEGHWIVVDEFDEQTGQFYVRDSYSAKAYAVALEEYLFKVDASVHIVAFHEREELVE